MKPYSPAENRILLVLGYQLPFPGAGWRRIEYFARYLRARGLNVTVIGGMRITDMFKVLEKKREERKPGNDIHILNILPFLKSPLYLMLTTLFAPLYLLILKPRVVFISTPPLEPFMGFHPWKKLFGYKIVLDVRDDVLGEFIPKRRGIIKIYLKFLDMLMNRLISDADFVTVVTQGLAERLKERYRLSGKVIVVPNGADLKAFNEAQALKDEQLCRAILGRSSNDLIMVFSGSVVETHNPMLLLPALMLLKKKDSKTAERVKIVIIGPRTELLNHMMELAAKYGISDNLKYLGAYKDIKDVARILSCADIGLIPRVDDPFYDYAIPAKFYEYVAMGLPVLALCRGKSELARRITENRIGVVCETRDLPCISQAIKTLLENPSLLRGLRDSTITYRPRIDRKIGAEILYTIIYLLKNDHLEMKVK